MVIFKDISRLKVNTGLNTKTSDEMAAETLGV
jgi:hypothetical protein